MKPPSNPKQKPCRPWLFDRSFHLLLHLYQRSMEMCTLQLLYPSSFSPIQTASDCSWHQDQNFKVKMKLRGIVTSLIRTFMPSNRTPFISPFIASPAIITPRILGVRLSVECVCADSQVSETISDVGFSKTG